MMLVREKREEGRGDGAQQRISRVPVTAENNRVPESYLCCGGGVGGRGGEGGLLYLWGFSSLRLALTASHLLWGGPREGGG